MGSIRNVAIIAHVDHGKTTLVDRMLQASGVFRAGQAVVDRVLDSNDLERERGITILSKNIAVQVGDTKINIIDTPGHSDFGGEVERVLTMADGTLLLVDAFEGPMAQTRFVLRKALNHRLRPVVVINKIDRPGARPDEVLNEVFDLFVELGADDDILDFPVVYASAKEGYARRHLDDTNMTMDPLFEVILEQVPPPQTDLESPFQFQVSTIDYDEFVGRIAVGRIRRGRVRSGTSVTISEKSGEVRQGRISDVFVFDGLGRTKATEAESGDIVALQGMGDIDVGDTMCDPEHNEPLERLSVDDPTLSMLFRVNDSPFAGQDGTYLTSRHLRERLYRETRSNVALRVEQTDESDSYLVSGRGVLHLSILIENMRREQYEFAVGKPKVIFKIEAGKKCEPIEHLVLDVPSEAAGRVMELLGPRRAQLLTMEAVGERTNLEFEVPARGLIGLRSRVLTVCSGEVVMHHYFLRYSPVAGEIPRRTNGVVISMDEGNVTGYALDSLKDRGEFFIKPGDKVYGGMIAGEHCKGQDIIANVCRTKKLTNIRASGSDKKIILEPPRVLSLEDALEFIEDDELVEVTPKVIRLRKRLLSEKARKQAALV